MHWKTGKTGVVWSIIASLLLTACAEEGAAPSDDGTASIDSYLTADRRTPPEALAAVAAPDLLPVHQTFAFDGFRVRAGDNTLTAPFDVQQLLASLAPGAAGDTLQAIADAGGLPLLGETTGAETLAGLSLWEQRIDGLAAVERRRLLWGQWGYRFNRDYLQAMAELFGPEMGGLDFRGDAGSATAAVEAGLDDRLALTEIGDRTRLVAAQTTRLQAAWSGDLPREVVNGRFGERDNQRHVPMLRITGTLPVTEGEDFRAVELPFAAEGLSLVVITPTSGAFDSVRSRLDDDFWHALRQGLVPTPTTFYLPLFSLQREGDISGLGIALNDMGLADFTPVNGAGYLYLETPRQRITLDVDADGLSAATVTAAVHNATADEPPYLFDPQPAHSSMGSATDSAYTYPKSCFYPPDQRPFLFAVYAADTGTLFHLGQVKVLDGDSVEADWLVPFSTACGDSPLVEVYRYK